MLSSTMNSCFASLRAMVFVALLSAMNPANAEQVNLAVSPIEYFHIGSSDNKAGSLEFIGGIEITSDNEKFGGFSGLRITEQGSRLYAVSDNSLWFTAPVTRDASGRISGLGQGDLACLCRADGTPYGSKHWGDAEALEISGNKAFVAFERLNRINVYNLGTNHLPGPPQQATASFKPSNIAYNEGLESVAFAPAASPLHDKLVAIAEDSPDAAGNHRGFIADKSAVETFSITRSDDYAITDATFLENGDLLILERRYGITVGLDMRIRLLEASQLKSGALVSGKTLMEAGLSSRIDNMEGISAWKTTSGETRITLISDDNYNSFQRTLMLEFRFAD
jgi:hypothetical protein